MREILFRGKENPSGKWAEGFLVGHCHIGDWVSCTPIHSKTVGQFTGLTDKNGNRIFEGDIVKCRHRIYKSNFEEFEDKKIRRSYGKEIEEAFIGGFNCFYWRNYAVSINDGCVKIQNGSDSHYIRKNYIYNHAIEVIGNIHDNPELLEKGGT